MTDWKPLIDLLDEHEFELKLPASSRHVYATEMKKEIEKAQMRENDNKRAATQIAVDAAKTFVQIAIALVVAIVGFIQFSYRSISGSLLLAMAVSGALAFLSMAAGFIVISRSYKKADGRVPSEGVPWSTLYLRRPINLQALSGLLALIIFAVSLALFNTNGAAPKRVVITLPDGSTSVRSAALPITVTGAWTQLAVEQRGVFTLALPPARANELKSIRLELR